MHSHSLVVGMEELAEDTDYIPGDLADPGDYHEGSAVRFDRGWHS